MCCGEVVVQLFEAAQDSSLLLAVLGVIYLGLVAVLAITAVFASSASRRKAALDVLPGGLGSPGSDIIT